MAAVDTENQQRDLYEHIEAGEFPTSWTLKMQIMPFEDAKAYRFNPFDLTKVWPDGDYPLQEVGRMTLNRNVTDYHAQIEQAAFEPNGVVEHRSTAGRSCTSTGSCRPRRSGAAALPSHRSPCGSGPFSRSRLPGFPGTPAVWPMSFGRRTPTPFWR